MNGSDDIEIQEGRQPPIEDRIDIADFLYEQHKEDKLEDKIEAEPKECCEKCGREFERNEMDLVDYKWMCKECEV